MAEETTTLLDKIATAPKRQPVIKDCELLIEEEVKKKGGLSGMAIKMAFTVVKAVKPGFITEAVDHLLDDFARRLEPFYQGARTSGRPLPGYFSERSSEIAEALLGITDARARGAQNAAVKKSYEKLRPTAKAHVAEAVPGLSRIIEKHTA